MGPIHVTNEKLHVTQDTGHIEYIGYYVKLQVPSSYGFEKVEK